MPVPLADPLAGGLAATAELLSRGQISAQALTDACLARIAALDPGLRSFVTLTPGRALAAAAAADRRRAAGEDGPLLGMPLTIKDMFDIQGLPVTAGMPLRAAAIARGDAGLVTRLQQAGAVILGTVKLAEGVFGEYRPPGSAPVNPWGAQLWPGASSGGSAVAVAARLCAGSLASDTGGSVRMPAAVTGTTGFKPGHGRLDMRGAFPLAPSFDHAGVIAGSVRDAALLYRTLDARPPVGADPAPVALGLDDAWLADCDPEVLAAVQAAQAVLRAAGVRIVALRLPAGAGVARDWYTVAATEIAAVHAARFAATPEGYGPALAGAIRAGQATPPTALQAARARLAQFSAELQAAMRGVDALLLPVFPFLPPSLTRVDTMDAATILALHRYTCPFSVAGLPALALPAGLSRAGLPLAIQLAAPAGGEAGLLAMGGLLQRLTDWHRQRPPTPDNSRNRPDRRSGDERSQDAQRNPRPED